MHGVCNTTAGGGGGDTDNQLSGPRNLKHRMDEVARMTRWHRIAYDIIFLTVLAHFSAPTHPIISVVLCSPCCPC